MNVGAHKQFSTDVQNGRNVKKWSHCDKMELPPSIVLQKFYETYKIITLLLDNVDMLCDPLIGQNNSLR